MNKKICFLSSSGGHYVQLKILYSYLDKEESIIVTEENELTTTKKSNSNICYLKKFNRKDKLLILTFFINLFRSIKILSVYKPDVIITTGAGVTVLFCIIAKILRVKIIYIESFAKRYTPTLTGKIMYRFADRFYVQWPELQQVFPKSIYKGSIY